MACTICAEQGVTVGFFFFFFLGWGGCFFFWLVFFFRRDLYFEGFVADTVRGSKIQNVLTAEALAKANGEITTTLGEDC